MRRGVWIIAGTPSDLPYPCRCREDPRGWKCLPTRCPCASRDDPPNEDCCGNWTTPEVVARMEAEYRATRGA